MPDLYNVQFGETRLSFFSSVLANLWETLVAMWCLALLLQSERTFRTNKGTTDRAMGRF